MNTFGRRIRLQVFGESHGPAIGAVLDGLPPGLPVDMDAVQARLDQRRPGTGPLVSSRDEPDTPEILSGVHKDKTTGAPLAFIIRNQDVRSQDYDDVARLPRPGHSDWVAHVASGGHNDPRGGGHHSGRLTALLVAAAALVAPILERHGVTVGAHLHQVGELVGATDPDVATMNAAAARSPVHTAHDVEDAFVAAIENIRKERDSLGGVVAWRAEGLPVGLGGPFFDSIESGLAHLFFAIPAVKGVDFGAGFDAVAMRGSDHNDPFEAGPDGIRPASNHAGGILGGRTTGAPLWGRVAIKPTSSIFRPQETVDLETGEPATLELKGRHDPCIAVRAVPVVRAAVELCLADLMVDA